MTTRYRYRWEDARAAYLAGDLTIKEFHVQNPLNSAWPCEISAQPLKK